MTLSFLDEYPVGPSVVVKRKSGRDFTNHLQAGFHRLPAAWSWGSYRTAPYCRNSAGSPCRCVPRLCVHRSCRPLRLHLFCSYLLFSFWRRAGQPTPLRNKCLPAGTYGKCPGVGSEQEAIKVQERCPSLMIQDYPEIILRMRRMGRPTCKIKSGQLFRLLICRIRLMYSSLVFFSISGGYWLLIGFYPAFFTLFAVIQVFSPIIRFNCQKIQIPGRITQKEVLYFHNCQISGRWDVLHTDAAPSA